MMIDFVLVSKDNLDDFVCTLKSITKQNFKDCRVIVVDSSSNQLIRDYILRENLKVQFSYIYEEPLGIYNAMNTGLKIARDNSFVWFLNPGDNFSPEFNKDTLETVLEIQELVWIAGQAIGKSGKTEIFPKESDIFTLKSLLKGETKISHQAFLARKELIMNFGGFKLGKYAVSDLEIISKIVSGSLGALICNVFIEFDEHGFSYENAAKIKFSTLKLQIRNRCFSLPYFLNSIRGYASYLLNS